MTDTPRESATLVLMRDRGSGAPEVLMVQRHANDAFAGGAFVFPGGVLEESDCAPESLALSEGLSPEAARAALGSVESGGRALGFYLAAIRETFEEVGVLLARTAAGDPWRPSPEQAEPLRRARSELREEHRERQFGGGWQRKSAVSSRS